MDSQFKAFLDSTQFLWKGKMLASKPAGIFYATSSQGGGQETAAEWCQSLIWLGLDLIDVCVSPARDCGWLEMRLIWLGLDLIGVCVSPARELKGGSPYGAGTCTDDGSRNPIGLELEQAFHKGNILSTLQAAQGRYSPNF
ncbi:NAD(P)H dehydrogenase (quinone) FQR1-like [Vigna umbellata]|nr:NAD(P)H dehydrogenase (quinone) FQR1-like [Vigna umbellata]